jgi:hypothetical protein
MEEILSLEGLAYKNAQEAIDLAKKQESRIRNLEAKVEYLIKVLPEEKHIFSRKEIGEMTAQEFRKNESVIMSQLKKGLIE